MQYGDRDLETKRKCLNRPSSCYEKNAHLQSLEVEYILLPFHSIKYMIENGRTMASQVAHKKKKNTTAIRLNPSMPSTFFESLDQNLGDDKGFFAAQRREVSNWDTL